jgi:hypothetical protein
MLSEDPYWHPGNMIYGDNPSTYPIPKIAAIMQSYNKYVFCGNNPIRYHDPSGLYYLEKGANGQVYAVIESGDTLSNIAYAEVRDSSAYTKMTGVSDYNNIAVGQRVNITGIYNSKYPNPYGSNVSAATSGGNSTANNRCPSTGEPGSTYTNPKGDSRVYGPDGQPAKDVDQPHGHNPDVHEHEWNNGVRGPARPVPNAEAIAKGVGTGVVVVGGGYLIYRGVRMLPSLAPPLWWTIPANVAIP